MKKTPYIFVFDIDNTIVGKLTNIGNEHLLYQMIYDTITDKGDKKDLKYIKYHDYVNDMKSGLMRPYFIDFIKFCKKNYKPCEFYINTLSSHEWTHDIMVPNIEKAANMKFNKPYYTREESVYNRGKSLKQIVDHIKNKYNTKEDLNDKILFIDDIYGNTSTYKNRQIKCPAYNNFIYRDIYKNLLDIYGVELLNNKEVEDRFIKLNIPYYREKSKNVLSNNKDYFELHKLLIIKETELTNEHCKKDDFFKILIEKLTNLSDKNIKKINTIVNKV
jgi:hypothetical protein